LAKKDPESLLKRASEAKRESKYVDFKREFDPTAAQDWVEIVKDLVAMANSGGGVLVIGANNDGSHAGSAVDDVLAVDPASISDKVFKYTGKHFSGFLISKVDRADGPVAAVVVEASNRLLVFSQPGTYPNPEKPDRQKTAFGRGTAYVRHGAKSEPANTDDIQDFIESRLENVRETWLGNIRKVVSHPDEQVGTYSALSYDETGALAEIRLTDNPGAPVFGRIDPDLSHPFRQKELIEQVNEQLPDGRSINTWDVQCVRSIHEINPGSYPQFIHYSRFGPVQYSTQFAEWLASQDQEFFDESRRRYRESRQS